MYRLARHDAIGGTDRARARYMCNGGGGDFDVQATSDGDNVMVCMGMLMLIMMTVLLTVLTMPTLVATVVLSIIECTLREYLQARVV